LSAIYQLLLYAKQCLKGENFIRGTLKLYTWYLEALYVVLRNSQ